MKNKNNVFFDWLTSAQIKEEADRVEQLQIERLTARRLAYELFLIQTRNAQDEQRQKEELQQQAFEHIAWDEALHLIRIAYEI